MPFINVNNANIYYEDSDPNNHKKPVMLFAHALLCNHHMYDEQIAYFKDKYRCIRYDFRGQGKSEITKDGYDMDTLAKDTVALLDTLNIRQCHFIGLSMGGFVGLRLAINHAEYLHSLILLNTSADGEDADTLPIQNRMLKVTKWLSSKWMSKRVMPLMFGRTFLADKSSKADYKKWKKYVAANNKQAVIKAAGGVLNRESVYDQLDSINTPTLIAVGTEDITTPYHLSERMHFAITGSKMVVFDKIGHTSTVEAPEQVNKTIAKFLRTLH